MASHRYQFRLYIVGGRVGSARAEPDLRESLAQCIGDDYSLEVVDLRLRPDRAQEDNVVAAPTVIRLEPQPSRRAIGSLADAKALAQALELPAPGAVA